MSVLFFLPLVIIQLMIGVFLVIAGLRLLSLKSYGLAVTASIFALLPCQLLFPLGMIFGIWSLVVLNRPEVKKAFRHASRGRKDESVPDFSPPSKPIPAPVVDAHTNVGRRIAFFVLVPLLLFFAACFGIAVVVPYAVLYSKPMGDILIYRVADDPSPDAPPVNLDGLVKSIDRRINNERTIARVRSTYAGPYRAIEIGVFGPPNSSQTRAVMRRLGMRGQIQLRLLAHPELDAAVRAAAELEDGNDVYREPTAGKSKEMIARWVDITSRAGVEEGLVSNRDMVFRRLDGRHQVLLLVGQTDITQHYISAAEVVEDMGGQPALSVTFTPQGTTRMTALSASNVSTEQRPRYLGIVIDGTLLNAPRIVSAIGGKAQLTGLKSREEVADLAAVLNAGPLPAEIQLDSSSNYAEAAPAVAVERRDDAKASEKGTVTTE